MAVSKVSWVRLPLNKNHSMLVCLCHLNKLSNRKWTLTKSGHAIQWLHTINNKQIFVMAHRAIMGAKKNDQLHHLNRDSLDNRCFNLRFVTSSQNKFNMGVRRDSPFGLKGVHYRKDTKKWTAYINAYGKRTRLGCFSTSAQAAKARDEAALKYHGEFARLNYG